MKHRKFKLLSTIFALMTCPIVLVATGCDKAIDDQYKITLDAEGKLVNNISYQDAIEAALTNPKCYQNFKTVLADEVVLKWFMNKMSDTTGSDKKNQDLRLKYDEWVAKINVDYDKIVQECRDKYGTNYQFYLQNEYLTPEGGTEASYKHNQLLAKVKDFFQNEVFQNNYFAYQQDESKELPIINSNVSSVSENELNDPDNWDRIGFYAQNSNNFAPSSATDYSDYLKKHLDGDYATLQNYIFDRWFATEQPFFSAAALFKYSNPKGISSDKIDDIYNVSKSKLDKIPDNPTEAFPFFGPKDITKEKNKGTAGFYQWYHQLLDTGFLTKYRKNNTDYESNGTISIKTNLTEDSQTLLLVEGSKMFQSLYAPYAVSHGSLYSQMFGFASSNDIHNSLTQEELVVPSEENWKNDVQTNNSFILKNFFYTSDDAATKDPQTNETKINSKLNLRPKTINSYIDLESLYVDKSNSSTKTCNYDIFKNTKDFTDFYGIENEQFGARYITNNFQIDLTNANDKNKKWLQPWFFELNESGMHVQTIDGYQAIKNANSLETKQKIAKNVLKYRLLEYKNNYQRSIFASANIFDKGSKLDTYFKNNYANIILEMALDTWKNDSSNDYVNNIFCSNFADKNSKTKINFLDQVCEENKFNDTKVFNEYLNTTNKIDWYNKALNNYKAANEKIFNYKKSAVNASKHKASWDYEKYGNGVLGPIGFEYDVIENSYDYGKNKLIFSTIPHDNKFDNLLKTDSDNKYQPLTYSQLASEIKNLEGNNFISLAKQTVVNNDNGFSPQIIEAIKAQSNCFWYKSPIVTKLMQNEVANNFIVNKIYNETFNNYINKINEFNQNDEIWKKLIGDPLTIKYKTTKILDEKTDYSCLVSDQSEKTNLINNFEKAWDIKQAIQKVDNYSLNNNDDVALNKVKATLAWLMTTTNKNDKENYFKNFYNVLHNKITLNKKAYVGYLAKVNDLYFDDVAKEETYSGGQDKIIYDWTPDVENIFDQYMYHSLGNHNISSISEQRTIDDNYWSSIIIDNNKLWAGFSGLLTETDAGVVGNNSELKKAIFEEVAKHSYNSPLSLENVNPERVKKNQGIWFAYSSKCDDNGQPIKFEIVSSEGKKINQDSFKSTQQVLGLAKAIVDKNSKESLRNFINDLIQQYYYDECPFKTILDKPDSSFKTLDDFKYALLDTLPNSPNATNLCCFEPLNNVQFHSNDSDNLDYSFINEETGDGYKIILTQINHEDVVTKNLLSRMKPNEFYNLVISFAMDDAIQKIALTEMIKTCYHGEKLKVYDAIINNLLNETWVKDWTRKINGK